MTTQPNEREEAERKDGMEEFERLDERIYKAQAALAASRLSLEIKTELAYLFGLILRLKQTLDASSLERRKLERELEEVKKDIETGFMQGAYARLKNLQDKEIKYDVLAAKVRRYAEETLRLYDENGAMSWYCLWCGEEATAEHIPGSSELSRRVPHHKPDCIVLAALSEGKDK